jgi:hypothetical protein
MTRLHIQVNQTIQFFRGQQGGSAPQRLFLSGGASIMPYTAQFFAEKLNVPVDYFNPFRNIEIDPALDLEELSKYAHSCGEVVGLGLRDLAHCPVELNLMPKSSIQRQEFGQKKPYLIASVFSLALVLFAIYLAEVRIGEVLHKKLDEIKGPLAKLKSDSTQLQTALRDREQLKTQADQMKALADSRFYWIQLLVELRSILMRVEADQKLALKTPENGGTNTDVGVWVESFSPVLPNGSPWAGGTENVFSSKSGGEGGRNPRNPRSNLNRPGGMRQQNRPTTPGPTGGAAANANDISAISLTCRAVTRQNVSPSANSDLAYTLQRQMTNSTFFKDAKFEAETLTVDGSNTNTFTFSLTVTLAKPFKL